MAADQSILLAPPTVITVSMIDEQTNESKQQKVTLRKLSLGKFALLTQLIDELLTKGYKIKVDQIDTQEGAAALIEVMRDAPMTIAKVIALVSDLKPDEAIELEVESAVEIMLQAWKLNNLVKVFMAAVKKAKSPEKAA